MTDVSGCPVSKPSARTQTAPGFTPARFSISASGTPVNSPALTAQVVVDSELISSLDGSSPFTRCAARFCMSC